MFGKLFNRIDERELANSILKFGGGFYKAVRGSLETAQTDIVLIQAELSIIAISVGNAFIGLKRKNSHKLMTRNTGHLAFVYGNHVEKITNGKVNAQSWAASLVERLSKSEGMEYSRVIIEEALEHQPRMLVGHFLQQAQTAPPNEQSLNEMVESVADCLGSLIDDYKRIGI